LGKERRHRSQLGEVGENWFRNRMNWKLAAFIDRGSGRQQGSIIVGAGKGKRWAGYPCEMHLSALCCMVDMLWSYWLHLTIDLKSYG
jgi:hypothetical protein